MFVTKNLPSFTVVLLHRGSPHETQAAVSAWRAMQKPPCVLVVDTTACGRSFVHELRKQMQVEAASLYSAAALGAYDRLSAEGAALDYALTRCLTDLVLFTSVDIRPSRHDTLDRLAKHLGSSAFCGEITERLDRAYCACSTRAADSALASFSPLTAQARLGYDKKWPTPFHAFQDTITHSGKTMTQLSMHEWL